VVTYQRVLRLHPGTAAARTARVLAGQVRLWHLGQAAAALRDFEHALRVAPSGALAPEARWGRILALRQLGRRAAELRACRDFVKRHPGSLYAKRVRARIRSLTAQP
jgi:tetratricopeptide (TPR) repeat protein